MSIDCGVCGEPNADAASFCIWCGAPLVKSQAPPTTEGPGRIDGRAQGRTRTGLFLMVTSFILATIPFLGGISFSLGVAGVILIYLVFAASGSRHQRSVVASIALWVILMASLLLAVLIMASRPVVAPRGGMEVEAAAWRGFVGTAAVVGSAFALPEALITYHLQDRAGRLLLMAASMAHVAGTLALAWILMDLPEAVMTAQEENGGTTALMAVPLLLILPIPSFLLWAMAYNHAYRRVVRGRIVAEGQTTG